MNKYIKAELVIVEFDSEDVITDSILTVDDEMPVIKD